MGSGGFGREVGWLDFLKDLCCGSGRVKELGGFKSADQFSCIKEIIRKEFQKSDTNNDGELSLAEVQSLFFRLNIGVPEASIVDWMSEYDRDRSGSLDFNEFFAMYKNIHSVPDVREEFYFAKFDGNIPIRRPPIEETFITVAQLQSFFFHASNGDDLRTEQECIRLIAKYTIGSCGAEEESEEELIQLAAGTEVLLQTNPVMSYQGFQLMLSDGNENGVADPEKTKRVYQDMTQPLSHYFISSSHNSYLLGNQLNGTSSPLAIKIALQLGVRVIELDTWDGPNGTPLVTHGMTACKATTFEECILALNEFAFEASDYPCIVTIENHCCLEQQLAQVKIMERILGDSLFHDEKVSIDEHKQWYSPEHLKRKFIVRAKIKRPLSRHDKPGLRLFDGDPKSPATRKPTSPVSILDSLDGKARESKTGSTGAGQAELSKDGGVHPSLLKLIYIKNVPLPIEMKEGAVTFQDPGFVTSSSIKEKKMEALSLDGAKISALNTYAKNHLIRVYPAVGRVDSSNYDPVPAWNTGCQIVALNYQTFRYNVWLNQGKFRINGGCGYVLKPTEMLQALNTGVTADEPHMELSSQNSTVNKRAIPWNPQSKMSPFKKKTLHLHILSAHYLPKSSKSARALHPFVEVCFRGVDNSAVVHRTRPVEKNGFHPHWCEEFEFTVQSEELSLLMFVVKTNKSFIGQYVIPVEAIRTGYRVVPLYKDDCTCIENAYLFCRLRWQAASTAENKEE